MFLNIWTIIVSLLPALVSSHYYQNLEKSSTECDCYCSGFLADGSTRGLSFCQKLLRLENEFFTVKREIEKRTHHIKEIQDLKERMDYQEELVENLQEQIESLKKRNIEHETLPTPEALRIKPEDQMLGDSSRGTRVTEDDKELAKNVSNLLAKVEEVENLTTQVQEELISERRVRRHLEEDLNETRSSIKILDDKLYNVTSPMNSRVAHVEEIMFSTLENMNKTLFEDHLQMLYYKVNGVVYKNETKELDERLDLIETELQEVSNTSALLEYAMEIKNLTETLMSVNRTLMAKLALEDTRVGAMELKVGKFEQLKDDNLASLQNVTERIEAGIPYILNDIQDIRNSTAQIEKELINQSTHLKNETEALKRTVSEQLENMSVEIATLRSDASESDASFSALQREVQLLAADVAITENRVHDISIASELRIKDVYSKLDNLTELWDSTVSVIVSHFIDQMASSQNNSEVPTENPTSDTALIDNSDSTLHSGDQSSNRGRAKDAETVPCSLPSTNDTHLMMSMDNDAGDHQQLEFGCRPIGRYVLDRPAVPLRCMDGMWVGPIPSCIRLLEKKEIEDIAVEIKQKNPCLVNSGDSPDPVDCSRFFKCWHGISERMRCPAKLHFDPVSKKCDYPIIANCQPHVTEETRKLHDLIPTILVEPDNVDKPYGLMGTGDTGQLVVYPRTSFTLRCLFPDNRWGSVTWHVNLFLPSSSKKVSPRNERNSVAVNVTAASSEDSGVYTCRSPFGKQNSITVIVQAVTCPSAESGLELPLHNAFYRPHPDGAHRILTTTVQYPCEGDRTVTAICQADGTWSRPPPTEDECPPKKPDVETIWDCPLINTRNHPDLLLEKDDNRMTITFKCAGNTRLIGNTYTRCYDGSWSHTSLPRCIPKHY